MEGPEQCIQPGLSSGLFLSFSKYIKLREREKKRDKKVSPNFFCPTECRFTDKKWAVCVCRLSEKLAYMQLPPPQGNVFFLYLSRTTTLYTTKKLAYMQIPLPQGNVFFFIYQGPLHCIQLKSWLKQITYIQLPPPQGNVFFIKDHHTLYSGNK